MLIEKKLPALSESDLKSVLAFQEAVNMQLLYKSAIREVNTKLEILDDEFHVRYDHNPIHHIESRLKSPYSIVEKLHRKELVVSVDSAMQHLKDIAGIRVICNYIEDVYTIADLLLKQDDVTLIRRRDYIQHPKPNGYRSLHLIVEVPIFLAEKKEPIPVEVQIRTIAMDFWASLEHQLRYKSDQNMPDSTQTELKDCAEIIESLDRKMQSIQHSLD